MIKREVCSAEKWGELMINRFSCHVLQSTQWADFKCKTGWQASYLLWWNEDDSLIAGASVLCKTSTIPLIKLPVKIMYVPRGPILNWENEQHVKGILADLADYARERGAVSIKIDPEVFYDIEGPQQFSIKCLAFEVQREMEANHWQYAKEQIQFKNTFWLSLLDDQDQLLKNMKQKTRYNVRLAEKKGVTIRKALQEDFHLLYEMYAETSQRDGFIIRNEAYYIDLWNLLYDNNMAFGLIAEFEGEPLAGMMNFVYQHKAWYFYGMSTIKHRNLMPTYLLQWEAILQAKSMGCTLYDLWGAPDEIDEADHMYGVFRFKQGLGASFVKGIGAWDYVVKPIWYQLISIFLPRILAVMRHLRRREIGKEVQEL